jgi:hypothetical protein
VGHDAILIPKYLAVAHRERAVKMDRETVSPDAMGWGLAAM